VHVVDPVFDAEYRELQEVSIEDYDGFTVASPANTHYKIGKYLSSRGKPVLLEKPAVLSLAQAKDLVDTDSMIMAGHLFLFHPAMWRIKELLPTLGDIQFIHSNRLNFGNVRTSEDVVWGSMPHDVSIVDTLMDSEYPQTISCSKQAFLQPGIADGATASLQYKKTLATIHVNWLWPVKEVNLTVICSEGAITFDLKELCLYRNSVSFDREGVPILRRGEKEVIPYEKTSPLKLELRYFLDHLEDDDPPLLADKRNIVRVASLLEDISSSD
jgi:UDP-2-acetamido-3-amino-2,3-dideoxy-glucuronate N-acetyltransferase